jgi:hypothetical protein
MLSSMREAISGLSIYPRSSRRSCKAFVAVGARIQNEEGVLIHVTCRPFLPIIRYSALKKVEQPR